ncbi:MAG: lipid-A-disaccharide synthase [candidate division WOR-3 bacterium]|nr:lipid-A-disaccharide synthase [candidate division WOR-3 bacterium]MCX7837506.1 lipid-A-disaccharide synthase [candidate division WOR-3 bacterium]MDW8114266.1 lipid-A-disaccharide synthase [candidate division WOR-3 bacterium]
MKILLLSGEPSGDLYLNYLIENFNKLYPDIQLYVIGNKENIKGNFQLLFDSKNFPVVGFYEGIKKSFSLFYHLKEIERKIKEIKPDIFIPISFPGFNLPLIKRIKNEKLKIVYFAPPQIWAWGKFRYKILKKYVDKMICLFPFEKEFYKKLKLKAIYVGNPLLEIIKTNLTKEEIKEKYNIKDEKVLILMPGSRNEIIKKNLLFFLKVYDKLNKDFKIKAFILALKGLNYKDNFLDLPLIYENHYELISVSDLVLTCLGTATLEIALLDKPFISIYFPSFFTLLIGKFLIKTKYFSLPNILLKEKIFLEFINPKLEIVYQKAKEILDNRLNYQPCLSRLKKILNNKKEIAKNIIVKILTN